MGKFFTLDRDGNMFSHGFNVIIETARAVSKTRKEGTSIWFGTDKQLDEVATLTFTGHGKIHESWRYQLHQGAPEAAIEHVRRYFKPKPSFTPAK